MQLMEPKAFPLAQPLSKSSRLSDVRTVQIIGSRLHSSMWKGRYDMASSSTKKLDGHKVSGGSRRGMSRRAFLGTAAQAVAVGAVATSVPRAFSQGRSAEPLRTIGLGVSIINDIQSRASKDLGFAVRGQAMDYGALITKMLTQNDQYEIAEGYFNDMDVLWPAGMWQPIDTERLKNFDKISPLVKTGKLTPGP